MQEPKAHEMTARIASASAIAVAAMALLAVLFAPQRAGAATHAGWRNVTAGGELRPGVYGRIDPGPGAPPPLVFKQPIVAVPVLQPASAQPVYLYVPPGQVRKWNTHCVKWKACELPVYFVRIDDSPSRLGRWSRLKDAYALHTSD